MKAVILAGGIGSRLSEETETRPKPMVEIGGRPILWHVMKMYSYHGINEFIVCLGYKGYLIKEFFQNYPLHVSDVTIDLRTRETNIHQTSVEPWRVTLVETGDSTMTGGRLKRVAGYLDEDTFCFTYGDGVADIDLSKLIAFHRSHGRMATVTAVQPPGRFGALDVREGMVEKFLEKPLGDGSWINGGFFVLNKDVISLIDGDSTIWEREPMRGLADAGQMAAYVHEGFWKSMDTLGDRRQLEELWDSGRPPWKVW